MATNLIQADPAGTMDSLLIAGTPMAVELVLEKSTTCEMVEQILAAHPRQTREFIPAALAYSAQAVRDL